MLDQLLVSPFSAHLRVINTISHCPLSTVVAASRLGSAFLEALQLAFCEADRELQTVRERSHIQHYVAVQSEEYNAIATIYETIVKVGYLVLVNS